MQRSESSKTIRGPLPSGNCFDSADRCNVRADARRLALDFDANSTFAQLLIATRHCVVSASARTPSQPMRYAA
jgi:hypothetical protein